MRVEIRTVNHRFLNLQLRTPGGMERLQGVIEEALRSRLARGHATVHVSVERASEVADGGVPIDLERARGYRDALRAMQNELGVGGSIDVGTLAAFRDVFQPPARGSDLPDVDPALLGEVVGEAADAVVAMREAEGARLADDLEGRLALMESAIEKIRVRAPERLIAERDRLRQAIADLLEGSQVPDEERIAREVAHLAERWDIHEELTRFDAHLALFRETLRGGSREGVGKRFGFISQEILREANTIGSKANDAEIARHVVTLKEEIERLREQLENVE